MGLLCARAGTVTSMVFVTIVDVVAVSVKALAVVDETLTLPIVSNVAGTTMVLFTFFRRSCIIGGYGNIVGAPGSHWNGLHSRAAGRFGGSGFINPSRIIGMFRTSGGSCHSGSAPGLVLTAFAPPPVFFLAVACIELLLCLQTRLSIRARDCRNSSSGTRCERELSVRECELLFDELGGVSRFL